MYREVDLERKKADREAKVIQDSPVVLRGTSWFQVIIFMLTYSSVVDPKYEVLILY